MPGVLIVEALAQTGGLFASANGSFDRTRETFLFMSISNAKFRRRYGRDIAWSLRSRHSARAEGVEDEGCGAREG